MRKFISIVEALTAPLHESEDGMRDQIADIILDGVTLDDCGYSGDCALGLADSIMAMAHNDAAIIANLICEKSGLSHEEAMPKAEAIADLRGETIEEATLEEEKPTAPMKPGEESMGRQMKQQQRAEKAPPKPQPHQAGANGANNAAKPDSNPQDTASMDDVAQAPLDKEAQQAIDTVDDGIKAGEEAKKILKQAGVIESYIAEAVEGMFKGL